MVERVKEEMKNKPPELALPLIRLKIENSGFAVLKSKRLNDHVINVIANQADFLQFYKKGGYTIGGALKKPSREESTSNPIDPTGIEGGTNNIAGLDVDENLNLLDTILKN